MSDRGKPRRVVIVGGGFAGLAAARALRECPVTVTLIDRTDHHLFQPLLYQCATGVLSEGQIATPLRHILRHHHNVDCVMAEVTSFDPAARSIVANRPDGSPLVMGYDDLIVACGAQQSYFGHNEFAAHAPGMKTITDALTIRRRLFHAFEIAETTTEPRQRRHWLTFAVVGAGPTGVELAGQIRELATKTLRAEYRHIDAEEARVLAFDGGPRPLRSFGSRLSEKATEYLGELGVELHAHSIVTHVDANGVIVRNADGTTARHDVGTVIWTAGVQAPPLADILAKATGAAQDKAGRIQVEPDCTIPGHPEISAVGDLMSLDHLPGVAEVAMQAGHYTGLRIKRDIQGRKKGPFRYRSLGSAAYLSRGHAVVSIGPVGTSGFVGWLIWLFVHIAFLTGFRNRVGAVLAWLVTFSREARRERALPARRVGTRSAPA
jgi:NADH:ubiquinone reductase (H+-translocating)